MIGGVFESYRTRVAERLSRCTKRSFTPRSGCPSRSRSSAIVVFVYGNARVRAPTRNAGIGVALLALVWSGVAYAIETPVEQCVSRTKALVAAAENGKWDDFSKLIDNNTTIDRVNIRGRANVTSAVQNNSDAYGLKAVHVLGTDVTTGAGTYDVTINTLLEGSQSTTARFTLQYEQRADGILLTRLIPLSVGTLAVDDMTSYIRQHAGAMMGR